MPAVSKGTKILVSGANGFIAIWVVRTLLERGYSVRGTVRTVEKGEFLTDYFQKLGFGANFEYVVIEDIIKDGAFDEAVKGIDAIEHTASPVIITGVQDPQDLIAPAVQGTVNMLYSALKYGVQVKRIVITSSVAAIVDPAAQRRTVYTEKDWNTGSVKEVEKLGHQSSPAAKYSASKTLAEQAAWEFYGKCRSEVVWDLVIINPPYVLGPPIHDFRSPSSLNASLQIWYDVVMKDTPRTEEFLAQTSGWVDVRDAALAHVLALEKEDAGGERIIVSAGKHTWQKWLDVVNSLPSSRSFPKGYPEISTKNIAPLSSIFDNTKEQRIFGIKYRTMPETAKDILDVFASRGW